MKICRACNLEKDDNDFSASQLKLNNGICRFCKKEKDFLYKKSNKDKIKSQSKQYADTHKKEIFQYQKIYRAQHQEERAAHQKKFVEDHKDDLLNYHRNYISNRYQKDPAFKLRMNVSWSIRNILKFNDSSKKGQSITQYLSYSIEELKAYLEKQFEPWMTWDNHGRYDAKTWDDENVATWTWQLDHIIPQATLPYSSMEDDNFKKCWALSNLRPLSAKQNQHDGATKIRHYNV